MKPLRIAQLSDFHFTCPTWNPFRLCSKRLLGTLNWFFSRKDIFSKSQVLELPAFLSNLQVDHVFLGGDFTTTSLPEEYEMGAEFAGQFRSPTISIPGNHDHYTQRAFREKHFYKYISNVRNLKHRTGFFNLEDHGVEAHDLGSQFWVVALDTSLATFGPSARGLFSEKLEERLLEILSFIPKDESILILNHYPFFQNDRHSHTLERGEALEKIVRDDKRIKSFLHGHTHQQIIADLQSNGLPVILDSGCCADREKGSWHLLTLDSNGIEIDVYRYEKGWKLQKTEAIKWIR